MQITAPAFALLLAAVIAAAHAFVRGFAAVAAFAGFNLNRIQGAVICIFTMVFAALDTAADIMVGVLLRHDKHLLKFCLMAEIVCARQPELCNVKNGIF